jgi:hypothetical protein
LLLHQYTLHDSRTVAHNDECDFAVTARRLDPTAHHDRSTNVLTEMTDFAEC